MQIKIFLDDELKANKFMKTVSVVDVKLVSVMPDDVNDESGYYIMVLYQERKRR